MNSDQRSRWEELIYPGTYVLRNLYEINDAKKWDALESTLTSYRAGSLPFEGFIGNSVADEIKAYHKYLFQDCYSWAGQFRTFDMTKDNFLTGMPSSFAAWETIEKRLAELDYHAHALDDADFEHQVDLLSYIHSELNEIHPFREGNGRATRAFMSKLAARYDINVDWTNAKQAQIIAASGSMIGDTLDRRPWKALYNQIASIATWDDEKDFLSGQSLITDLGFSAFDAGLNISDFVSNDSFVIEPVFGEEMQVERDDDLEL